MRVLLVEPWYGGSHRAWADGLARHSAHDIRVVGLPAESWRWRLRGASVTLAPLVAEAVAEHGAPDVVMVSGMVDLAGLLGQTRRLLAEVPVGLYLHENQLGYPQATNRQPDLETSLVNWTSMVAADRVFVNSTYHRDQLLGDLPGLLDRVPDDGHRALLDRVGERTTVLPVGVELGDVAVRDENRAPGAPPLVLWSHRWEPDKNPRSFFGALDRLVERGVGFRLAVTGEQGHASDALFDAARERFADRIVQFGHLPRDRYTALLASADVVVSAAHHEYFGIAMVEAMAAGAVAVLPDDLSYPELVPEHLHPWCLYPAGGLVDRLAAVLDDLPAHVAATRGLAESMQRFRWEVLAPVYDAELEALVAGQGYGDRP